MRNHCGSGTKKQSRTDLYREPGWSRWIREPGQSRERGQSKHSRWTGQSWCIMRPPQQSRRPPRHCRRSHHDEAGRGGDHQSRAECAGDHHVRESVAEDHSGAGRAKDHGGTETESTDKDGPLGHNREAREFRDSLLGCDRASKEFRDGLLGHDKAGKGFKDGLLEHNRAGREFRKGRRPLWRICSSCHLWSRYSGCCHLGKSCRCVQPKHTIWRSPSQEK